MRQVTREHVIAFRLRHQHLDRRLPAGSTMEAVAACGLQDTPPGSAILSLHARVAGITVDTLNEALHRRKSLLETWSLRGAPYVFPTQDAPIFSRALLSEAEESRRFFILGATKALDLLGLTAGEAMERTSDAIRTVLDGRRISGKRNLDVQIASAVAEDLSAAQQEIWRSASWYGPDQQLGEAVVSFGLRLAALRGDICFANSDGETSTFVRTDQWLGHRLADVDPSLARAELVRRYLRCYGPSHVDHLASWAGISPEYARACWDLVQPELEAVEFAGRTGWLLTRDVGDLDAGLPIESARLLPPLDAWARQRDRETIVADSDWRRKIWRSSGWPGLLLLNGEVVGIWRGRKVRESFHVTVDLMQPVRAADEDLIRREAELLAPLRESVTIDLSLQYVGDSASRP